MSSTVRGDGESLAAGTPTAASLRTSLDREEIGARRRLRERFAGKA